MIGKYFSIVTESFKFIDNLKKEFFLYMFACNIKSASGTSIDAAKNKAYFQNFIEYI